MSCSQSFLRENYKGAIAAGSAIGGFCLGAPAAVYLGAGYLGIAACNYLFDGADSSEQFKMKETAFYERLRPYMPRWVDSAVGVVDNRLGWKNTAFGAATLAAGMFGGIYSAFAFGFSALIARTSADKLSSRQYSSSSSSETAEDGCHLYGHIDDAFRQRIADENAVIMANMKYKTPCGKIFRLNTPQEMIRKTLVVKEDSDLQILTETWKINLKPKLKSPLKSPRDCFTITNEDCLKAYQRELMEGRKPVILNNANQDHAGGGYLRGAAAQEEDLLRRIPDAYSSLNHIFQRDERLSIDQKSFYRSAERSGCIYTHQATLARDGQDRNYELMEQPMPIDIITSAAPNLNKNLRGHREDKSVMGIMGFIKKLNSCSQDEIKRLGLEVFRKTRKAILFSDGSDRFYLDNKRVMKFSAFVKCLPPEIIKCATGNTAGKIEESDLEKLSKDGYEQFVKDKICWQIKTAIATGHDSIIISAWGCGAFRNDPSLIAKYYEEVYKKHFAGQIRLIFPILGSRDREAFQKVFSS